MKLNDKKIVLRTNEKTFFIGSLDVLYCTAVVAYSVIKRHSALCTELRWLLWATGLPDQKNGTATTLSPSLAVP